MEENGLLLEALKQVQKKHNCVNEIFNLTKEMGSALSRDDKVSVQMLLGMRQDEMNQADKCDDNLNIIERAMLPVEKERLKMAIKMEKNILEQGTFEEKKIAEFSAIIKGTLKKTIEIDRSMSVRISGVNSFYTK